MCHKIGHFPSRFEGSQPVLTVPRMNRRSLYNGHPFCTLFFPESAKSGARGRGSGKYLLRKGRKTVLFPLFSGSGSSWPIRGPGVGALAGTVRNRSERGKVSSRTPFHHPGTLNTWVFPRLFPQWDSRYNTLEFGVGSRLDRVIGSGSRLPRAVAPKGLREPDGTVTERERAGSCRCCRNRLFTRL